MCPARPPPRALSHTDGVCGVQDGGWIVCRALPGSAAAASGVPVERNSVLTRVNGVDVGQRKARERHSIDSGKKTRARET